MGLWNHLLAVDLDRGEAETRPVSPSVRRGYLGGAGFTTRLLYDEVGPDVAPLDPGNVLAIAPGLLVGPSVPTGSKTTVGFKSPLTGGYGQSVVGAKLGNQLKRAGYDALDVRGAAAEPTTLVIDDDRLVPRFTDPAADGSTEGKDEYERELDRYYAARGWTADGVPMAETLVALDLPDTAADVGARNELGISGGQRAPTHHQ